MECIAIDSTNRTVDAELDAGRAEEHGGGEHGDGDGLAEAARRGDEDFGGQVVPRVGAQDLGVLLGESSGLFRLEKCASARLLCI